MATTMGLEATVHRLQGVDLLPDLTHAQLEEVARLAERVQVAEGEVLAREGRIGREFFLLLSGSVAVTQMGRRVNTLGSGDFFGGLAAMDPGPRNATVTALTDLDVLIIGPRELSAMSDIPGFRGALFRSMASRLRTLEGRLAELLDAQDSSKRGGPRPLDIADFGPSTPCPFRRPPNGRRARTLTVGDGIPPPNSRGDGWAPTATGRGMPHRSASEVLPG